MPKVKYVAADGCERIVEAELNESVMEAAIRNGVPGIVAECGGNCSCATCHVYVRPGFVGQAGPPGDLEDDLLELGVSERRSGSRLSCQIRVTDALDGLVVDIPREQP